jgi:hypothetical protein
MKSEPPKKPGTAKKPANGRTAAAARTKSGAKPAPPARPKLARSASAAKPEAAKPAGKVTASARPKSALKIPPILLEGDEPVTPSARGPGERYALGPGISTAIESSEHQELPEAYGTQRLLLAARDPHWLYAHWDLTRDQLRRYNSRSIHRHLVLRIFKDAVEGLPHREIHVHPESRNWFAHVALGGTKFVGQLGYYRTETGWVAVSTSSATVTPPDAMSNDLSVWFETMPVELSFEQVLALVKQAVKDHVPLMEALQQLRATGFPGLPDLRGASSGRWTAAQDRALAQIISMDAVRRVWMGSLEITELLRRQFLQELSSLSAAQLGQQWSGAVSSVSSPFGAGEGRKKGFWFNVNAELIIYGATEADAKVAIGGRQIKLRSDGTFSYRFSLPDGQYGLPAVATSSDGTDSRSAGLKFSRSTRYDGEVHAHPQDPALRPPLAENVA